MSEQEKVTSPNTASDEAPETAKTEISRRRFIQAAAAAMALATGGGVLALSKRNPAAAQTAAATEDEVNAVYPRPSLETSYLQSISFVDPNPETGQVFPGFEVEVPQYDEGA